MKQPYHGPSAAHRPASLLNSRLGLRRLSGALLLALGLTTSPVWGQATRPGPDFVRADAAARAAAATSPLAATLARARSQALTLDEPVLRAALATAPPESRTGAAPLVLAQPQPDGTRARFALHEATVMAASMAAQYPRIRTYAGVGLDDATATVRLDLTPRGFHAQVLSGTGPGFVIAPARSTDTRHYLSYYRQDVQPAAGQAPSCGTVTTPAEEKASAARVAAWRAGGGGVAQATGAQLRTYRLALACTPGFSVACGNTMDDVLAVQATLLNRINGLFERELTVRLVLAPRNKEITFLSGTGPQPPVPYFENDSYALPRQNQENMNKLLQVSDYDLGLVLGNDMSGGGGAALSGSLCTPYGNAINFVAGAPTGASLGDTFIETVAHELGHVFGALHTFNSGGVDRYGISAWEPGSGVTMMSYAGRGGVDNDAQPNKEFLFHTGSYEQIQATMSARNCGTTTPTGNMAPVVAGPASGKTLPISTPFQLTATASDADNDPLTYSWEEFDLGPAGTLTQGKAQVTGETPPLFRSWRPVTTPTRYFPCLADLVKTPDPLARLTGEFLPTVTRPLTFRCTARDLHNGTAGVVGGISYSTLVKLNVSAAAGPFVVTAPNAAGTSWAGGSTQTVTWNVANTAAAPVSCAKVNLRLSLDGGLSYPLTLATGVANAGTASVVLPNAPTSTARVMVEAADNYFFDISDANFTISPNPGPTITSFTPAFGPVGTTVSITGTNLNGGTSEVRINGTLATNLTVVSATNLTAKVGAGSTSGLLTVTTSAGTVTSATPFLVGSPPTIASFTPASGLAFTTVTLTGTNFLNTTQVQVNGRDTDKFYVISATQLTLTVPDGATTGPITVTTPFGKGTSAGVFTVPLRPVITSFTPNQGPAGTTVVLAGRYFANPTRVGFGGIAATLLSVPSNSDTQLTVMVPAGAITGPLSVTTALGLGVSGGYFTVVPTPALTSISPASGVVGTTVTLTGTALDQVVALTLNGGSLTIGSRSATTLTFVVPAGASTGAVLGTASGGGGTSSVRFTVLPPAAGVLISGIVPTQAITGAAIRLTGTGLSGATLVTFSGSSANTVSSGFAVNAAGTELSGLVVPNGAVTGPLSVTTSAGTSAVSAQVFTVCALPAAQAQNARLVLGPGATTTLAPTAVSNASTANCGVAGASMLSVVPSTFTTADIGPAVVARALSLNGNGQYVAIGSSATMPSGDSPYTIEAWIKPTTMGGNSIFGWGVFGGANACNALRLSDKGLVNYWWSNDLEVATPSLVGAWHHVAATYDGTTRTLYLDGKAIGADQPRSAHVMPADARNLRIGSTNSGEFFNGSIDEVRVWNVARTAAQLNAAKGMHLLRNPAGLVAYYRFGEGSGTATADANGVATNAGTLTGGASWTTDAPAITNGVPVVLTVTDASGHTATAPAVVTVLPATATATAGTNATAFSVWPNPVGAKGLLHVSLPVPATAARLSLRNALGQLVRTRTFAGSGAELPTAGLASGVYLLNVQADGHAPTVRRIVVE